MSDVVDYEPLREQAKKVRDQRIAKGREMIGKAKKDFERTLAAIEHVRELAMKDREPVPATGDRRLAR